ncbi:MAG TPA: hypothetical protein VJU82_06855 [Acidobacteriaceae bacterium]|nr:hypothetical protein [Acidobacteriaceae bacterium]
MTVVRFDLHKPHITDGALASDGTLLSKVRPGLESRILFTPIPALFPGNMKKFAPTPPICIPSQGNPEKPAPRDLLSSG